MTIGQRIKEARKSAGLTQRELAEKAGTATGTIQQYELGKRQPRIEQFQAIADVLNVDVNWLMNGYTLAQRDQAFRDFVKKRFSEVEVWKTRLDEIGQDLGKLNDEGRVEAVKRVKELTEIPRYQATPTRRSPVPRTDIPQPPAEPPQSPPAPQEGNRYHPAPGGHRGDAEGGIGGMGIYRTLNQRKFALVAISPTG